jgi:hypothetical protein
MLYYAIVSLVGIFMLWLFMGLFNKIQSIKAIYKIEKEEIEFHCPEYAEETYVI